MSEVFRCDDKETLVAYLYGEVEADVRREVERHLRTCVACTRESEALQTVRDDLQLWMPPEHELDFAVVQKSSAPATRVLTSSRWASLHRLPTWAQVAAAVLCVGIGAAIANVNVRSTADGFVVTTGWLPSSTAAPAVAAPAASDQEWRRELVALEQNLRRELTAQRSTTATAAASRQAPSNPDAAAVLRRVQAMIDASEDRQRQELATRLIQAERMWNVRRQTDIASINQKFGTLQGRTFAVQANQQEVMNQLLRRASTQPNQ